ncbi:MAG: nitrite/sulfite reductase, partial [Angustibacter sp.]
DLWVGGGLSTNPRLAERLGAWVALDDVPDVWAAVTSVFRDHGYRRLRNKARLKYLLADWGVQRFREVVEEYLGRPLVDGPAAPPSADPGDHVGVHRQRDGRFFVGATPVAGRVSGTLLRELADLAEGHGSQRVRLTPHQKVLVLDVDETQVDALITGLDRLGLQARPSPFRRYTLACTGIEFCKLAIVETKQTAARAVAELERRLVDVVPDLDTPITLNVNGCPNSCARVQVADIGLKGQIVTTDDGTQVPGFQVHLGGALGLDAGFGRKVRGHKVTAEELPEYVERVVRRYVAAREPGERFAQWAVRADEEELG